MFKQIDNREKKEIQKYKNDFYTINENQEVINIVSNNVDKLSNFTKQFLVDYIQNELSITQIENVDQIYDNNSFYDDYIKNYDQSLHKYQSINYHGCEVRPFFEDQLIRIQVKFYGGKFDIKAPHIQLIKRIRNRDNKNFLNVQFKYKSQQDVDLIIMIDETIVTETVLNGGGQYKVVKLGYGIQPGKTEDLRVKIFNYSSTSNRVEFYNLLTNLVTKYTDNTEEIDGI